MSIASVYARLKDARDKAKQKFLEKGAIVNDDAGFEDFPDIIDTLPVSQGIDLFPYIKTVRFDLSASEITDDITLHLEKATSLASLFNNVQLGCQKITLYISNLCTSVNSAMRFTGSTVKEVEIVGDTSSISDFTSCFHNMFALERIIGEIDFSGATSLTNVFAGCSKLQSFDPKPGTIRLSLTINSTTAMTVDALQKVVDGLADMAGQDAPTLKFGPTLRRRLTDEQETTILGKNWILLPEES